MPCCKTRSSAHARNAASCADMALNNGCASKPFTRPRLAWLSASGTSIWAINPNWAISSPKMLIVGVSNACAMRFARLRRNRPHNLPHHHVIKCVGVALYILDLLLAQLFDGHHLSWCQIILVADLCG